MLLGSSPDAAGGQQTQEAGLDIPLVGSGSLQTADFLTLGAEAVEGTFIIGQFLPTDPRPEVQAFVEAYRAAYDAEDPDLFAVIAYDAIHIIAEALHGFAPPPARQCRAMGT